MKKIALIITFSLAFISLSAQQSFNQRFSEANMLMEEKLYNIALPLWLELQVEQPANFNVNYKVGVCYINSANEKSKALSFMVKAVQNTTKNYDPFSTGEKKAPVESYFYLARAYHINYELDQAILNYNFFKQEVSEKHYLYEQVDHHIQQCENAKIAVANPVKIKVSNLGNTINSVAGDYSPALSLDESTIYFTSRRIRKDSSNYYVKDISDGKNYEDIYISHKYDDEWSEPQLLGINTEGHEATLNVSSDGQIVFIYKDDNGDGNIYISKLFDDEWSAPEPIGSDINLSSRESHAHISPDGDFLYFVSDRKKGEGNQDIYFCNKLPNGKWAKAQNVGNVINTPYDEDGIFIHPNGKIMYFSSKGHNSIGGYDIYSSTMNDNGKWSTPVNLGYPINSTDDDVFFVTSADGKRGYFSSFKNEGYGEQDIYMISMIDAKEIPLTLLTGHLRVIGQPETPSDAIITVTNNETDDREKIYRPRKKDGKFSMILAPGNDYHIIYSAAGFSQEEDLFVPPISAYQEMKRDISLVDVVFGKSEDLPSDLNSIKEKVTNEKDIKQKEKETNSTISGTVNTNTSTKIDLNNSKDTKIAELEAIIADLKKQVENNSTLNTNTVNTNYIASGNIITSYQEYFNYNIKSVKTSSDKFQTMLSKALAYAKSNGKITIEIESSASHVPTKTYRTNRNLASERANDAADKIIKVLSDKGVNRNNIVIRSVNSSVGGPKYNNDFKNTSIYEKYQYVIIKIR